jgi:SAM-dependent methyltransferase
MAEDCWLATTWPRVSEHLPAPPARVVEIGCGPLGGFVPAMNTRLYHAVGVDPDAPDRPAFHRLEFEAYEPPEPVDAVVACTALHHVTDLDPVLDRVAAALVPGGTLVVIEWAWERFDEPTARWCFDRLDTSDSAARGGWLRRHRDQWKASGQTWEQYRQSWATAEGLHTGKQMLTALDARFQQRHFDYIPYFACDLAHTAEAEERGAISRGHIQATGFHYVATQPDRAPGAVA